MHEHANERWYQLCQQAAIEPDSEKLLALVTEVNLLLDAKDAAHAAIRCGPMTA
jgi:hypothetical protein